MQEETLANAFAILILQNLVLTYDAAAFNWRSDIDAVDKRARTLIDGIDADLSAFRDRGDNCDRVSKPRGRENSVLGRKQEGM
jgi:hypothetical protein